MSADEADALLSALGAEVGLRDLAFDGTGGCSLTFDEVLLHLQVNEAADRLLAHAVIGPTPRDTAVLERLLRENLALVATDGGTLALTPSGEQVVLSSAFDLPGDPRAFPQAIEDMVNTAEAWTQQLHDAALAGTPEDHPERLDPTRFV